MSEYFGPEYDYVSFDPRGVGYTEPRADCFANPDARSFMSLQMERAFSSDGKPSFHEVAALYKARAELCNQSLNNTGAFMGTAFVARDILRIHEESWKAAGKKEEKGVQYWGQSYGTLIGVTFASMFPDKVERFIIDGNASPDDYMAGRMTGSIKDADAAFDTFYTTCSKSKNCVLNPDGKQSAEKLRKRVKKILEELKSNPIPVVANGDAGIFTYAHLTAVMSGVVYSPIDAFPLLAQILALTEARDPSVAQFGVGPNFYARNHSAPVDPLHVEPDETLLAVGCSDQSGLHSLSARDLEREYHAIEKVSKVTADSWMKNTVASCHGWKIISKERIEKFGGRTKNPILFAGNTFDPSTPLSSTKYNSKLFPGSAWFEQESAGHLTTAAESDCSRKILVEYIKEGKLPRSGTKCKPEWVPFERPEYTRTDGYSIRKPQGSQGSDGGDAVENGNDNTKRSIAWSNKQTMGSLIGKWPL